MLGYTLPFLHLPSPQISRGRVPCEKCLESRTDTLRFFFFVVAGSRFGGRNILGPGTVSGRAVACIMAPGRRGGSQVITEDVREEVPGPSQAKNQATQWISEEESNKLTAEVMRYLLFKNHQQPGVPIKRRELTALITDNYKQRALPTAVIEAAKKKLAATFGFELRTLDRSLLADQGKKSSQDNAEERYVLRSTVPGELLKEYVETKETAAVQSFTIVILAILQLAGDKVPEDVLFIHLRKLGIDEKERHPVFGNIKDALDKAIKQRYVIKAKPDGQEHESCTYELAERALDKDIKDKITAFIESLISDDN